MVSSHEMPTVSVNTTALSPTRDAFFTATKLTESGGRNGLVSPAGAMGTMQVMPATGRQYGITNLWDPASNLEAGITHLRSLLDRFPLSTALAAYNAGEVAVQRFSGIPPYPETRSYVSRILKLVGR